MKVRLLRSLTELRDHAAEWNDLWKRSTVAIPIARAEHVELWVHHFAPAARFTALVVESKGSFLAALPLFAARRGRSIRTSELPNNAWGHCGQLLVDADCDRSAVLSILIDSFHKLSTDLVWLDEVRLDTSPWVELMHVLRERNVSFHRHERYRTAIARVDQPLAILQDRWTQQKRLLRSHRVLVKAGEVAFVTLTTPEEIEKSLEVCFEIEDSGWKGQSMPGGSILKRGTADFFRAQSRLLAEAGMASLYGLLVNGRWISFLYCCRAKGTLFLMKIGYDLEFRTYSPGQNLQRCVLGCASQDEELSSVDFVGEVRHYQLCWDPVTTPVGQLIIPNSGLSGRALFLLYDTLMPWFRRLRAGGFRRG